MTVEKRFTIILVQAVGNMIALKLQGPQNQGMRVASIIQPKSEDEKIAREMGRVMITQLQQIPGLSQAMQPPATLLLLTFEEYEKLGKPTVGDVLLLKISVERGGE